MQLIDIRSDTFAVVSDLLSPLESPEYIVASHIGRTLDISLPRLGLAFFVNTDGELECRSMPGYVVDTFQSCGTLFGLKNKLILCPNSSSPRKPLLPRRVIIPQGDILFSSYGDFTHVSIDTHSKKHVRWYEYTINTDLGCLTSNTSLGSKLYQCYLHALTSHCLPDPLLGHMGTEEALYILRSAASRSFQRLDVCEAKLLELIGDLSPTIVYTNQSIVTVQWKDLPVLSQHHDFCQTVRPILDHAVSLEALYDQPTIFHVSEHNRTSLKRVASRNKTYYPSDLHISEQLLSADDVEYRSRDVSDPGTAEHVVFQTSWSIWNGQSSLDHNSRELWGLINSWSLFGPANKDISLRYSRHWLKLNAVPDWFMIHDLCCKSVDQNRRNLRISLSFCLSAAVYSQPRYSGVVPFAIILALDERCRNMDLQLHCAYELSDGLSPELTRLRKLITRAAVPNFPNMGIRAARPDPTAIAKLILRKWPDYQSVDFPPQWFDKSECNRRLDNYSLSISRNIRLHEYIRHLQSILQSYGNVSIPTAVPYVFSPQFITRNPKTSSYSFGEVLMSRTNVPIPSPDADGEPLLGYTVLSPTGTAEPSPVSSRNLTVLIGELRNSRQPLLQLYGNELNKSHRVLLGKNSAQVMRGAVPSHELLLAYHEKCSHKKDKLFSEIFTALAPSQNVEETSHIAGLWPRITPRSLLRQLAQDHISMLPDQWKSVIMRYAVAFLRHRQSARMLELSSRQQNDELLQEIEAIRYNVLEESTADWLLVQVRPIALL